MSKYLLLIITPLLGACATHAPMSEMVMFNKNLSDERKRIKKGVAVSYIGQSSLHPVFTKFD